MAVGRFFIALPQGDAMQPETEQISEAGRVISRANGNLLRNAYDALKSLLSFVEQDEEAEEVEAIEEAALIESIEIREYAALTNQEPLPLVEHP